jgi:hypothetical protein
MDKFLRGIKLVSQQEHTWVENLRSKSVILTPLHSRVLSAAVGVPSDAVIRAVKRVAGTCKRIYVRTGVACRAQFRCESIASVATGGSSGS